MTERTQPAASGKVWFIGAGPGDPDLITVKGRKLIEAADLVLYAGSLVPAELVACAKPGAHVVDSAPLALPETHALLRDCALSGGTAARVHTGEPAIYGALREQSVLLDADGIPWEVVPGVSSAFAAVDAEGLSFTVPGGTQTFILTRLSGRTPVPDSEALPKLAAHGAAMAVLLSASEPERVQQELLEGGYPPDTLIVIGHKVGWPGGGTLRTTLADLAATARKSGFTRQTVFLVLPGQKEGDPVPASKLYDPGFAHGWRAASEPEGDA